MRRNAQSSGWNLTIVRTSTSCCSFLPFPANKQWAVVMSGHPTVHPHAVVGGVDQPWPAGLWGRNQGEGWGGMEVEGWTGLG
jgi:hypothetical protein